MSVCEHCEDSENRPLGVNEQELLIPSTFSSGGAVAPDGPSMPIEICPTPISTSPTADVPVVQFYGVTGAAHGVHMPDAVGAEYRCEDCLDLERRIRKAFKELGYEF